MASGLMRAALAFVGAVILVAGCREKTAPQSTPVSIDASQPALDAAPAAPPPVDAATGELMVTNHCLSCHSREIIEQQRLTSAQWSKVVAKMATWGSLIGPDSEKLARYLSDRYGPQSGPWRPKSSDANEARKAIEPTKDGPLAGGNAALGKGYFAANCAVCHGADAGGLVGVNLVDRAQLFRATEFANSVRTGRGLMPPHPITDRDAANVLAYLRALR